MCDKPNEDAVSAAPTDDAKIARGDTFISAAYAVVIVVVLIVTVVVAVVVVVVVVVVVIAGAAVIGGTQQSAGSAQRHRSGSHSRMSAKHGHARVWHRELTQRHPANRSRHCDDADDEEDEEEDEEDEDEEADETAEQHAQNFSHPVRPGCAHGHPLAAEHGAVHRHGCTLSAMSADEEADEDAAMARWCERADEDDEVGDEDEADGSAAETPHGQPEAEAEAEAEPEADPEADAEATVSAGGDAAKIDNEAGRDAAAAPVADATDSA